METVHVTSCPLNCWDVCGLKVTVNGGKVVRIDGDEHHPITKGTICGRGRMIRPLRWSSSRAATRLFRCRIRI
ncbi:Molybdopterin oxidoreductase Fe4S4 domain [[Flavobacterium] thermophilum]|nr:Molybdopterin oxidoreductase Fe4S4 domain protein [Geobacillus sp. 12AMOR1]STO35913.1 Molybdopterin oxidoreductase Fe4S4 domain [[Flavobacterium] thermophilum]